jgi:hypothetical protein
MSYFKYPYKAGLLIIAERQNLFNNRHFNKINRISEIFKNKKDL